MTKSALEYLSSHIDYNVLLEHYDFDRVSPERGGLIRSCCKLHGGSNPTAFVVNTENNLWYCHTGGCGGGDAYDLVQHIEDVNFATSVKRVAEILGVDIENLTITERQDTTKKKMKNWLTLMRKRSARHEHPEYVIREQVRTVTKFRNFLPSTMHHFNLGYVASISLISREGKPYTLKNRLVFPIVRKGVQIGVSLRRVNAKDNPKWSHQPNTLETRHHLYNSDAMLGVLRIIVCEGALDVWAFHEIGLPAVATFGAHLTDEQYELLLKSGAEIVWAYDGDDAGRMATEKAIERFRNKADMWVVPFGATEDPASISRQELGERYANISRRA